MSSASRSSGLSTYPPHKFASFLGISSRRVFGQHLPHYPAGYRSPSIYTSWETPRLSGPVTGKTTSNTLWSARRLLVLRSPAGTPKGIPRNYCLIAPYPMLVMVVGGNRMTNSSRLPQHLVVMGMFRTLSTTARSTSLCSGRFE